MWSPTDWTVTFSPQFFFFLKKKKIGIDFMKNDERKKELLLQKGSGIQWTRDFLYI